MQTRPIHQQFPIFCVAVTGRWWYLEHISGISRQSKRVFFLSHRSGTIIVFITGLQCLGLEYGRSIQKAKFGSSFFIRYIMLSCLFHDSFDVRQAVSLNKHIIDMPQTTRAQIVDFNMNGTALVSTLDTRVVGPHYACSSFTCLFVWFLNVLVNY